MLQVTLPDEEPVTLVMLQSDPICNSAGCTQYLHKKTPLGYVQDYFVPNFGPDPDMEATASNIALGEAAHAHKLIMGTPASRAKWHNVAKDTLYNYDPDLDEDMRYTASHLDNSEMNLGHKWVIEDEAEWSPNYVQLPENTRAQVGSDNQDACSSEMCFHSNWY